jgi:hypothetical protein
MDNQAVFGSFKINRQCFLHSLDHEYIENFQIVLEVSVNMLFVNFPKFAIKLKTIQRVLNRKIWS